MVALRRLNAAAARERANGFRALLVAEAANTGRIGPPFDIFWGRYWPPPLWGIFETLPRGALLPARSAVARPSQPR